MNAPPSPPPADASASPAPGASPNLKRIEIRLARPDERPVIRDLLTRRDERVWDDAATSWFLHDLDPERCVAWLAFADGSPAGLSTLFRRTLLGPGGPWRAGYWANLFIVPEHRDAMIYPMLVRALLAAAAPLGFDVLYGATRQRPVAFAHTRAGFTTIGRLPVLLKPIRPARLLGKYRRLHAVVAASPALDVLWRGYSALRHGGDEHGADRTPVDRGEALGLLAAAAADRIVSAWTAESLEYRYRRTREGTAYVWLPSSAGPTAGLVYRVAERGPGIRAAVVMDAFAAAGEERRLRAGLVELERRAWAADCDVVLHLGGLGPAVRAVFEGYGYRATHETYDLQVWPKRALEAAPALGNPAQWRFAFGDHDAF